MEIWIWFLIIAIIAVVVEIFVPTLFCINFAFAGVLTAIISIFWNVGLLKLFILFAVLLLVSVIFIRPLLAKMLRKGEKGDFHDQYIGKVVKCIETITMQSGAITIYDERWDARLAAEGEEIPAGAEVKIVRNEGLVMFVEKI